MLSCFASNCPIAMDRIFIAGVLAFGGIVLGGCGSAPEPEQKTKSWTPVTADDLSTAQAVQRDRAVAARDAMKGRMKGRLMEVMPVEGLAGVVRICSKEAGEIARNLAKEHNVNIGRTSFKLRNTMNAPPTWAQPLVKKRVDEPRLLAGPDGQLAALYPIHTAAQCLACHGPKESIPEDLQKTLAEKYPEDTAIGHAEGDLRGWLWVEVPAADET